MPPKLNIARATEYAVVDPAFIDLLKTLWKRRWKTLNDEILTEHPSFRKVKIQNNAPIMSRLKRLCTDPKYLDMEITRLRGLPYERFYVREYMGRKWLVGLTRPITMTDDMRRYQAPRYYVYFPDDLLGRGTDASMHLVPQGHEMTTARHPHHNVRTKYYDDNGLPQEFDLSAAKDPLDLLPATCWGSFGTIAGSCIAAGDITDLYRNMAVYLTRINQNSLLTRPFSACYFLQDIGPADPKPDVMETERAQFVDVPRSSRRRR